MNLLNGFQSVALLLVFGVVLRTAAAQSASARTVDDFVKGKDNFVVDADESVKEGAAFLPSPTATVHTECVQSCCDTAGCNVALMERGEEEGQIESCFLFNCLYKTKFVCKFVKKSGYFNYVLNTLSEKYLRVQSSPQEDSPPVADAGNDLVVQPKEAVTLNGLMSRDDKKIETFEWTMLTNYKYAVVEPTSFPDQFIVSNLTSGKYTFQLMVTDTIGQSDTTMVTVLVLTPEESENHCMIPKKSGPCRGSFPRWHHNAASGNCEPFAFGGCLPNLNNYLSEKECKDACSGTGGPHGRGLPVTTSQGEKCGTECTEPEFKCDNGCCLEMGEKCDGTPQCSDGSDEARCEDIENKFRILQSIPLDEKKARCAVQPDTGSCRESISKWYYDPHTRTCARFNYGGCEGNDNKFDTEETCINFCHGVTEEDVVETGVGHEKRESDDDTNYNVIVGILCAAIIVVLIVLGYCFLKRRKNSGHEQVPSGNNTGMGDRDNIVYKSTTKPV